MVAAFDHYPLLMSLANTVLTGPAPSGLEALSAQLEQVLQFHAAHGGPFLQSVELEYATRRIARAWLAAALPEGATAVALARSRRGVWRGRVGGRARTRTPPVGRGGVPASVARATERARTAQRVTSVIRILILEGC